MLSSSELSVDWNFFVVEFTSAGRQSGREWCKPRTHVCISISEQHIFKTQKDSFVVWARKRIKTNTDAIPYTFSIMICCILYCTNLHRTLIYRPINTIHTCIMVSIKWQISERIPTYWFDFIHFSLCIFHIRTEWWFSSDSQ